MARMVAKAVANPTRMASAKMAALDGCGLAAADVLAVPGLDGGVQGTMRFSPLSRSGAVGAAASGAASGVALLARQCLYNLK